MDNYNRLTYKQTVVYHEEMRNVIFESIENEYQSLGISANEITYQDTVYANSWKSLWAKSERAASWDWTRLYYDYQSRSGARRFDLAIRKGDSLIGLCYGELGRDRLILKLHALERAPIKGNPLSNRFVDISLFAANLYANLNDTSELWLCNPVSPVHTRLYKRKGYTPQVDRLDRVTHLMKRLK